MSHPYKAYQRNQGPAWLGQLDKYVEQQISNLSTKVKDAKVVQTNYGGDEKLIKQATYVAKGKK